MTPIIPKLGLRRLRDNELPEYTQDKIDKVNAAPTFATVNPSTATVSAKKTQYETALVKADNGTKADTALKDQRRVELEELLTAQAIDCAKIANGDFALYLTTGFEAKNTKGNPTGILPVVKAVALAYGDNSGELKLSFDPVEKALNYTVWAYSDINNPNGSLVKEYIIKKIGRRVSLLDGLPSGQVLFVRVRANGGSTGFGPWSDPAEKRAP